MQGTTWIRTLSLLTPVGDLLVTRSTRWKMVARDIYNRFGWQSNNRLGV